MKITEQPCKKVNMQAIKYELKDFERIVKRYIDETYTLYYAFHVWTDVKELRKLKKIMRWIHILLANHDKSIVWGR